jgi:predicted permease
MLWDALFRKVRWERRLDAEMRFHLAQQVQDYVAQGLSREEAQQRAYREFGGIELSKEECRDQTPFPWLEHAIQDIRYGSRLLIRNRTFSLLAIFSLALGIGATASVFSVVDRILFRSLPYGDADRLISIGVGAPMLPYDFMFGATYLQFRRDQTEFSAVTSWSGVNDCDLTSGEPTRLVCASAESSFLSTLGIVPALGRSFTADEDGPNRPRVVLLSYGIWRSRFGGHPDILGRTILVDGEPNRVVGVLPPDFETPTLAHADLVIPQGLDDAALRRAVTGRPLRVIARLRPGVTIAAAQAAADLMVSRALSGMPPGALSREIKPHVKTLRDLQVGDAKTVAWVLFGSVLAVLLLACANVANLLLTRTEARRRELAARAALGASRTRLVRQALTESLLLALPGGLCGFGLAYVLLKIAVNAAPEGIPRLAQATLDWRVLAFTLLCSLGSALLFGTRPALANPGATALFSYRSAAGGRGRFRQALIVAQLAFSLALLSAAGLLSRALWRYQQIPLGMDTQQVLTASLSLSPQRYPTAQRRLMFAEELEERLRSTASFAEVAVSDSSPPGVPLRSKPLAVQEIDGRPQESPAQGTVVWRAVSPGYFRALAVPIRQGRGFTEQDRDPGREVMIVSQSLARRLFHDQNPVGHFIGAAQIVGTVVDVRNSGGTARDDAEYYVPRSHAAAAPIYSAPDELRRVVAIVRTPLAAEFAARAIRDTVAQIDAALPVRIETLRDSTNRLSVRPRFNAMLLAVFATLGLLLSAFGIYGVLGFLVAQRTKEIGVRIALGATPRGVVRLVLGNAMRWLAAGMILGLALSMAFSRAMNSMLYGMAPYDLAAWTAACTVLVAAALTAAWQPARRAARVDPAEALRHD